MEPKKRNLSYLGFGLYWTWVYLSFNSIPLTGTFASGIPLIPVLHIVSGMCGVLTFAFVIAFHRRLQQQAHCLKALVWTAAAVSALGTLLYTLPFFGAKLPTTLAGAVVTGLSTPLLALAWGVKFCRLDARSATVLTAASFLVAGVGYEAVSCLPQPLTGIVVAFMPALSAALIYLPGTASGPAPEPVAPEEAHRHDLRDMVWRTDAGRVMIGLVATMFVCGGLRIYLMQVQEAVYSTPMLFALPTTVVAALFLVYGLRVPHNSLNLGPFYRMAMPLFALAFVLIAMFGSENSSFSFVTMSAGATLVDMITWVLLIEVVRSTRFSALLVMACGRLAIHLGMALGELAGVVMADFMTAFFVVSIVVLMVAMGYMFTDRATTFFFEPPTESEIRHRMAGHVDGDADAQAAEGEAESPAETLDQRIDALAGTYSLTPRETEVFSLWASGYGSKAIQDKLAVSPSTVKTHLRHIYEKCDVHSRADILELLDTVK